MFPDYRRLSRADLQRVLKALRQQSIGAASRDQILHELQAHGIELEMQNRELRETRQELEEARDRYADLYDFAPVGYVTLDRRGRVLEINITGAATLGQERADILGLPFVARVAPGESKLFQGHVRAVLQAATPVTAELRIVRAGETVHVRLESTARRIGGETVCRTAIIDISKRKQAEQELRQAHDELDARVQQRTVELQSANRALEAEIVERKRAEKELRQAAAVFEHSDQAIVIMDPHGDIVGANPAFTRITGYTAEEAAGKNVNVLYSERHDEAFWRALWETVNQQGAWQGEVWKRRKDGELFAAWQTIGTVTDERGDVVNYVGVFADISPLKASETRLKHLAHHGLLTDLPNRLLLDANLDYALELARRHRRGLVLLFLDLDQFKRVNDTLGHKAGDQLLKEVAARLYRKVRAEDTVARLGGDEFVIVLEEITRPQDAAVLAEKTVAALRRPILLNGREVVTSVSIGISIYPDDGESGEDLLKAADAAMYQAKKQGGDAYRFYDSAS